MAAFINALSEEGTLGDCRRWVSKIREETNSQFSSKTQDEMTKEECLTEISKLWYSKHNVGN